MVTRVYGHKSVWSPYSQVSREVLQVSMVMVGTGRNLNSYAWVDTMSCNHYLIPSGLFILYQSKVLIKKKKM